MSLSEEQANVVKRVESQKQIWATLSILEKRNLLVACRDNLAVVYPEWVSQACEILDYKNEPKYAHLRAEANFTGPCVTGFWINGIVDTYDYMLANGQNLPPPVAVKKFADTTQCTVFPRTFTDKLIAGGVTAELHIEKGKEVVQTRPQEHPAGLALVLGAGNYSAPLDILTKLYITNQVVIYKPNPIYEKLVPIFRRFFAPLVEKGFLDFVVGGADVGSALLKLESVGEIVLTGGKDTFNKIVWGGSPHSGVPNVTKPICAELGSVNPVIIVPGKWTPAELDAHCQALVKAKMLNGSHICASPQVLLTCKNWPQRQEFLDCLQGWFKKCPATRSYYPGTDQKYQAHLSQAKNPVIIEKEEIFPAQKNPLFVPGTSVDEFGLGTEAFCPVLYEVPLDVDVSVATFLPLAVKVANEKCDGELTASILIDNESARLNPQVLEEAIDDLRVGAVGVNQLAVATIMFAQTVWGAYPGNTVDKVGSGIGQIGNCHGFNNVTKSVLRAPFTFPAQEKIFDPQVTLRTSQRIAQYAATPSTFNLTKVIVNAITGL
eukprot:c15619_g1_i1.p1 GENE.c15619_g1_i1~~c15619_g1_i1.p1  ORF type:complete len:566 (+),score=235.20 c15619_g1_i1:56-1699(+)